MTKELKNAVSRLRKLQDAAFNGKIDSYKCVLMSIDIYNHHYDDHDHASVTVTITAINDDDTSKRLHYDCSDDENIWGIVGEGDDTMTHDDFLQHIAQFIDYPV
jgi:hypothetical protein